MENFNAALKIHALAEFDKFSSQAEDQNPDALNEMQISDDLVVLLEDREMLTSHVEASKENIDSKISDKETEIVKTIQEDWKMTETRIIDS